MWYAFPGLPKQLHSKPFRPWLLSEGCPRIWPDPRAADPGEGLVAVGADLSADRLMSAYSHGIFPWYNENTPILWWSPEPRAIVERQQLHVSRSLRRRLRRHDFVLRSDSDFDGVLDGCADRNEGTWILPEVRAAYVHLHALGLAHSIEVWEGGQLAGGLYGVQVGGLFAAESMFHRTTDASKIALVSSVHALFGAGFRLFDVQFMTAHLATLGATEIPRSEYLTRVSEAQSVRVRWQEVASLLEEPGFVPSLCAE